MNAQVREADMRKVEENWKKGKNYKRENLEENKKMDLPGAHISVRGSGDMSIELKKKNE